jgi:hypothetical protein
MKHGPDLANTSIKVYDLSEDTETIRRVRKASSGSSEFGIVQGDTPFGSKEWFQKVETGAMQTVCVEGTINKVYFSGHGDWPQFEIASSEGSTEWTRLGRQEQYKVGKKVRLEYVDLPTKKHWGGIASIRQVLKISIEE